jgi:glycerophosphoryl diester phosphodiesterase
MGPSRRAFVLGAAAVNVAAASPPPTTPPIVIAHRGASGERPEHTPSAYRLAIAHGADFVEPDVVVSRDGVLICRHETEISATTDVAGRPEFAARRTRKSVDGAPVEGWFVEDFTLAELKTLRCRERIADLRPANAGFDGQEPIVTLQELVDLVRPTGTGLYIELKHPTDLARAGHDTVALLAALLQRNGLDRPDAAVFAECFEVEPVRRLRTLTKVRLTQLVAAEGGPYDRASVGEPLSYADMLTPPGLRRISAYADGIGVEKRLVLPRDAQGRSLPATTLTAEAHAADLPVHAWTFRSENAFLPRDLRRGDPADPEHRRRKGDHAAEYAAAFAAGVDGLFSDHPADALAARNRLAAPRL